MSTSCSLIFLCFHQPGWPVKERKKDSSSHSITHAIPSLPHEWRRFTFFVVKFFFGTPCVLRFLFTEFGKVSGESRCRIFFFFVFFCVESAPDRPTWVMTWLGGLVRSLNHSGDFTLNQWEIGNNRAECETRCGWLHAYKHYRINPTQSSWIQSHVGLSTGFNKQNNLMRKINRINSDYETL